MQGAAAACTIQRWKFSALTNMRRTFLIAPCLAEAVDYVLNSWTMTHAMLRSAAKFTPCF